MKAIKHITIQLFFSFGFLPVMSILFFLGCRKESVFVKKAKPEVTISANDIRLTARDIHFFKDTVYVLNTKMIIDSAQTFSIDAGTLIKVNDGFSIVINPAGVINAVGTSTDPIIFTSSAFMGSPGILTNGGRAGLHFWYGIRIYGNALSSVPTSSGTLSYMRIEFAGGDQNNSDIGALLFQNVTNQTMINNIEVSYAVATPSFEFYGGNCNANNLVSYATVTTDFFIHKGYTGKLQNLLAYRHPYFSGPSSVSPFGGMILQDSTTFPVISNLTVLGPDLQPGTERSYYDTVYYNPFGQQGRPVASLITTGGTKFHIRNSVLLGFPKAGWYLDDRSTAISLNANESDFTYSIVHSNDSSRVLYLAPTTFPPFTSKDFAALVMRPEFSNRIFLNSSEFMLQDPFNYNVSPNPLPTSASPLLTGANFDGVFSDPFFNKVSYVGALGSDNWMAGWTNFIPLQTNYND